MAHVKPSMTVTVSLVASTASATTTSQSAPTYALEVEVEAAPHHLAKLASPLVPLTAEANQFHVQFRCSAPVTSSTQASLTLNDFSQGGDGGSPSECDNKFHDNSERVVALSTLNRVV